MWLLLPFSFIVGYYWKVRRKMLIFVAVIALQTQFAVTVLCTLEKSFGHAAGVTLSPHAHIHATTPSAFPFLAKSPYTFFSPHGLEQSTRSIWPFSPLARHAFFSAFNFKFKFICFAKALPSKWFPFLFAFGLAVVIPFHISHIYFMFMRFLLVLNIYNIYWLFVLGIKYALKSRLESR